MSLEYKRIVKKLFHMESPHPIPPSNPDKLNEIYNYMNVFFGDKITIPSIVVSGTKGKGSTCFAMESMIRTGNIRTCLYTSPHLITPRERIRINGQPISEDAYVDLFNQFQSVIRANNLPFPHFFGIHTIMCGLAMKQFDVEAAVIECGIGGRFDWTKMYQPTVGVITRLEYDHLSTLGNTPESIAWNKAGICTPGLKVVTGYQQQGFKEALYHFIKEEKGELTVARTYFPHEMGLKGPTAEENTSIAKVAARYLNDIALHKTLDIKKGARECFIPGRYQTFVDKEGFKWLLDGAHTKESVLNCFKWYKNESKSSRNDVMICATTKERDPTRIFSMFKSMPFKKKIYVKSYSGMDYKKDAIVVNHLNEAIRIARKARPACIFATGSLHLIGDILRNIS